ncbi:SAM-dependent methyltransferase [Actinocorallia sp. API 0066]|uniref:TRM11 family SAM-dependent methyltransferase n=1 Tax=Actinocorallia sp. API 0066 TaxID=2896846 RepID=UPI0027E10827|nr:SAM-dependent methyltransferase [Actinocorallia sp. API 0066]
MSKQRFGILILPSANRVYADASVSLMAAELRVLDREILGGRITGLEPATFGGVPYLTFTLADPADREIAFLSNLSALYALFRIAGDGGLHPVPLAPLDRLDDDLLTIQKYAGKTNEQFTKMLLNVTVWASASGPASISRALRVLDPMCGRGTTLNQALMYGWNADGMDIDTKDFEAYAGFLRTWLKRKRLKHTAELVPVRRDRKLVGRKLDVTLGLAKDDYKAGDKRRLTVVNADTTRAAEFFAARSFDAIVTDAPYGVQHGARTQQSLSRSPSALLEAALPAWTRLLKPGGTLGIAWNTHVTPRSEALRLLADAGLDPLDEGPYRDFAHRVDQSILRDIVIARKPT